MKVNFVKYIFIIIVISLIGFAVYFIYNNVGTNNKNKVEETIQTVQYSKEITIGVSKYDNINPIVTNNKEIINISKLIFEPLISLDEEYKKQLCLAKEFAKINSSSYLIKINKKKNQKRKMHINTQIIKHLPCFILYSSPFIPDSH